MKEKIVARPCGSGPVSMRVLRNGFTLIELLVVVLIIGILAAIAVPQYQKAVERAKASQALIMLKSVMQAMDEYYMTNGEYTYDLNKLTLDIPLSGTDKFMPINITSAKSNDEWTLTSEISNGERTLALFMMRKTGKYKGAGFIVVFRNTNGIVTNKSIKCYERIKGANYLFDSSLGAGAYCKKVMQGNLLFEDDWGRAYTIF